jgi:hypothetical protein
MKAAARALRSTALHYKWVLLARVGYDPHQINPHIGLRAVFSTYHAHYRRGIT